MRLTRLVPVFFAALAAACDGGGGPAGPTELELASIRVTAYTAGTPIATLAVEVTAADIPTPLVFNLVVDEASQTASGTLRMKPGLSRTITVRAFDSGGEITHEGVVVINVNPGPNPPIQITLTPRSGQVPVTVSFGSFSVIVYPGSATVGTGSGIGYFAEVLDQNGQPTGYDPSQLTWASTNPAIVSVDEFGTAITLAPGSAKIVATYDGIAGEALVTVYDPFIDADGDGFLAGDDCDDTDPERYPGAPEVADGKDNDCDGAVDEDTTDADGDTFVLAVDCNDSDPAIHPGAAEVDGDGVDSNCDGLDGTAVDLDLDGYTTVNDCDDSNADVNPGAVEVPGNGIDDNCDGLVDLTDNDFDGWFSDSDCDDNDASINPGAPEVVNGIDDNCNGVVDEDLLLDQDGDGFTADIDCDDTNSAINPGAVETAGDGIDSNCNGSDDT
jgi:hypothetical protein